MPKRADRERRVLMLQMAAMAVTMAIAVGVSFICSAEQSFWIPLTAFCVSLYIDTPLTALRRTVNRILGSIYGVIIARLVCLMFPEQEAMLVFLVVFAGLTLWSRVFFKFYYFFVAFMTATVIMLLSILMIRTPLTPDYLITERLIFTAGGAFISLAASAVIMPSLERPDMLRTYRHYLTRFYLEYRASLNRLSGIGPKEGAAVIQGVFRSARDYSEKLPLWSYALLFDRFVYRSFVRFLHRIHKMRIMNAAIASSIDALSLTEASGRTAELLARNRMLTKKVMLSLMILDRERAQGYLRKLSEVNEELSLTDEFRKNSMATVVIALRDIELDLSHITNGTLQLYLAWKNSGEHEPR